LTPRRAAPYRPQSRADRRASAYRENPHA